MPADATIQNALIVIAVALSVQTVLLLCTVIAISVGLKRAHAMLDAVRTARDEPVTATNSPDLAVSHGCGSCSVTGIRTKKS